MSLVAFGEADVPDPQFSLSTMQWGQIMTHDMSMLAGSTQSSKLNVAIFNLNGFNENDTEIAIEIEIDIF